MNRKSRELYEIIHILLLVLNFTQIAESLISEIGKNTNPTKLLMPIKCCPNGYFVNISQLCEPYQDVHFAPDFSKVPIYNKDIHNTGKTLTDIFDLAPSVYNDYIFENGFDGTEVGLRYYLIEDGTLYVEYPNDLRRWMLYNKSQFCLDLLYSEMSEPRILAIYDSTIYPETNVYFISTAMLVSCVFLLLVLFVYCVLPELRNLGGLVLMSYVISLLGAFLLLAALQLLSIFEYNTESVCVGLTFSIYYFFLATFCWMNIMSFDIWWTFRGYAKARMIHRRGQHFKFGMYSLYAWGVPLAMTIAVVILNTIDMKHLPWFVTPKVPLKGCFIEGDERLLYLYIPMVIMIVMNWMFFLLTAYNIWRLNRGTAVLDSAAAGTPAAHRTHRQRLMVYLKLSVIMGINWVLEVISSLYPELKVWYITDTYNLLIGMAIFLIFVCKRKILVKLIKRFHSKKHEWAPYSSKSRSTRFTTDSESSQETPLRVSSNPKSRQYSSKQF